MAYKQSNRLTDSRIKGLIKCPPDKGRPPKVYFEEGGQGFGLRIHPTRKATFFLEYRFDGRKRNLTIGSYPCMSSNECVPRVVFS